MLRHAYRAITLILGNLIVILLIIAALLFGAYYLFKLPPSNNSKIFSNLVLCHRGSFFNAPEDTLASFRQAHLEGCTNIEMDVRATKDKVLVILHDETLDRTTDAHGSLKNYTYADLQKVHIVFKGKVIDEKIPTLEQALQLVKQLNVKAELSIWLENDLDYYAKQISAYYKKMNLYNSVFSASFYPPILYHLRTVDPNIITSLEVFKLAMPEHPIISRLLYWSELSWLPYFLGVGIIEPNFHYVSLDMVNYWKKQGIYINAFTLNSIEDKAWLMHHGITFQTDCFIGSCPEHNYHPWDGQ